MSKQKKKWELVSLEEKTDRRGSLCFVEKDNPLPFSIKRSFWVYGTPARVTRGHHAHKKSRQGHVCLRGSAKIYLDDGKNKEEITLAKPNQILILKPKVWHSFRLKRGSLLFVFTSDLYNPEDYIRDYAEFLALVKKGSRG